MYAPRVASTRSSRELLCGRWGVRGLGRRLGGGWAAARKLAPSVLAPCLAMTMGEVANVNLVVRVVDELACEGAVDRMPGKLAEACNWAEAYVVVVVVYALASHLRVPCVN